MDEKECKTCGERFKIRPFKFKMYRVGSLNKPFTRSGRVFGHILHMIDSIIEIATFGYFESNLFHEWTMMELNKFG